MLALGTLLLLSSLVMYWHVEDVNETLKESAEDAGTLVPPGADQDYTLRFLQILIVIACMFLSVGVLLVIIAFARGKRPLFSVNH